MSDERYCDECKHCTTDVDPLRMICNNPECVYADAKYLSRTVVVPMKCIVARNGPCCGSFWEPREDSDDGQ